MRRRARELGGEMNWEEGGYLAGALDAWNKQMIPKKRERRDGDRINGEPVNSWETGLHEEQSQQQVSLCRLRSSTHLNVFLETKCFWVIKAARSRQISSNETNSNSLNIESVRSIYSHSEIWFLPSYSALVIFSIKHWILHSMDCWVKVFKTNHDH